MIIETRISENVKKKALNSGVSPERDALKSMALINFDVSSSTLQDYVCTNIPRLVNSVPSGFGEGVIVLDKSTNMSLNAIVVVAMRVAQGGQLSDITNL